MPTLFDAGRENADLLALLERIERGEEVVVLRDGRPIAKVVALRPRGQRSFGALRGRSSLDDRFFEPLPPEELAAWEDCADPNAQRPPPASAPQAKTQGSALGNGKPLLAPKPPAQHKIAIRRVPQVGSIWLAQPDGAPTPTCSPARSAANGSCSREPAPLADCPARAA